MTFDFSGVSAAAAVLAVLVGVIALIYQIRLSRFAIGVETLLKLDERFEGRRMVAARRKAAQSLLKNSDEDVEDVLDFFDMVGLLTRRGAVDAVVVWNCFFEWIRCYWILAEEYVKTVRQEEKNPAIWAEAEWLYRKVVEIEKRHSKATDEDLKILSREKREDFLNGESSIDL